MVHRSFRSVIGLAGPLFLATTAVGSADPIALAGPACFDSRDNDALSFKVIQQAPPPGAAGENYQFYPLTGAASARLGALANVPGQYDLYYFQWANRADTVLTGEHGTMIRRKANLQPAAGAPRRQRSIFGSIARADGCTLAQAASVLNQPARARHFAQAAGIRLVTETAQPDEGALADKDLCVLAEGALPEHAAGIMLDYEVQDGRSPAQTLAFLRTYAAMVHASGHRVMLMTNPFDAPTQVYTGLSAKNAHAVVAAFDQSTIWLWSRNRQHDIAGSYRAQKAVIEAGGGFDGSRILVEFELANTTLADAQVARDLVLKDHLAGVLLWRNGVSQGGACATPVNEKIATLVLGHRK